MSDIQAFVDQLAAEFVAGAPPEVQEMVLSDSVLQDHVLALQGEIRDGLLAVQSKFETVADLERVLRTRKTAIVARGSEHAYTVERTVAAVIEKVLERARAL